MVNGVPVGPTGASVEADPLAEQAGELGVGQGDWSGALRVGWNSSGSGCTAVGREPWKRSRAAHDLCPWRVIG